MAGDAFLDVIGSGGSPARPLPPAGARRIRFRGASLAVAAAPMGAMLACLAVTALTGLSRRSSLPEAVEPYAYGFFLDRYPLFAFALVYAAARIVAAAAGPGPGGLVRRIVFAGSGIAVLLLASLYPTFGGLALRGGFMAGGMAFLTGQPLWGAYALGAAIAAATVGGIVGLAALLANSPLRPTLRRFWRGIVSFTCLWWAAGVVGLAHAVGTGPWPARTMLPAEALAAAALLIAATLPHAMLVALPTRRSPV